jgi:hypothetical protein
MPKKNPQTIVLGPPRVDRAATSSLRAMKLRAKSEGDFSGAVISAGYYAKKRKKTMWVYGGTSYGWKIWRVTDKKDEYDGELPKDVHVLFADTHKEREETYDFVRDCAKQWNVPVHWVERPGGFAKLIEDRGYVPNPVTRFCTTELKIRPIKKWMRARGYEHWGMVIGVRADEVHRMVRLQRGEGNERWWYQFPLVDAGVCEDDVMAYWRCSPFDLRLKPYESNCDLCFLKGVKKRLQIITAHPELATWWIEQETKIGATFRKDQPVSSLLTRADLLRRQLDLFPAEVLDVGEGDCLCGD